ncbi:MAG: hemolysin family protein [Bacillota bacterium]
MQTSVWQWALLFILVLASAFLSAAETAINLYSRVKLRTMAEGGHRRAALLGRLKDNPRRLESTLLIADSIISVAATALFTAIALRHCRSVFSLVVAVAAFAAAMLLLGKMIPRNLAAQRPELIAGKVAFHISWIGSVVRPLLWLLTRIAGRFTGSPTSGKVRREDVTEDEIRALVDAGERQGVIQDSESEMIHSVLELADTPVRNVMVPRTAITAISIDATHEELLELVRRDRHSRFPVYEGDIDNIVGLVHAKDICSLTDAQRATFLLRAHLRPTVYVIESASSGLVLRELQRNRIYMAIVIDEYGGTAGLVTIEDLIEEIVGEIADEYDDEEPPLQMVDDATASLDARLTVEEVNEELGLLLPVDRAETLGGLVLALLGRIPQIGDSVVWGQVTLTVDRIDRRSIERVRLRLKPD